MRPKFKKGQSGNPNGRPKGKRNKATVLFEDILLNKRESLINKAIELAEKGEVSVLNKLLDKIAPSLTHNKNENFNSTEYEKRLLEIIEKANNE